MLMTVMHYLYMNISIKYRNYCSLICADDKHKVPIGEEIAASSGVRNNPSLVPTSSDHDFAKISCNIFFVIFLRIIL